MAPLGTPLRLALVGCGKIVEHHARALLPFIQAGRVEVTALCDPSASRTAEISSILGQDGSLAPPQCVDSLDSLLTPPPRDVGDATSVAAVVDAALLAVPHDLHLDMSKAILSAGKHCLLEKPLAPVLEECREIREAGRLAAASNAILFVAEQSPYWPEVSSCLADLKGGGIGELMTCEAHYYESLASTPFGGSGGDDNDDDDDDDDEDEEKDPAGEASVRRKPAGQLPILDRTPTVHDMGWRRSLARCGGGIVIDGGLHWLRPLRMFLEADGDRVVSVVAATADHLEEELAMEGETSAHAILRTQHGRLATFRATLGVGAMAHSLSPFFRVTGRAGELVISGTGLQGPDGGSLTAFRAYQQEGGGVSTAAPETEQEVLVAEGAGGFGRGFGNLWEDFIGVVARGDAAAAQDNVDEATRDVVLATAIYQSAKERKWIELSPLIKEAGLC